MFKTNQPKERNTMQTQQIQENTINNFIANEYIKNNNKITIVNEYSDFNPTMNSVESSRMNHYKLNHKKN